jgi:hypothetical protein
MPTPSCPIDDHQAELSNPAGPSAWRAHRPTRLTFPAWAEVNRLERTRLDSSPDATSTASGTTTDSIGSLSGPTGARLLARPGRAQSRPGQQIMHGACQRHLRVGSGRARCSRPTAALAAGLLPGRGVDGPRRSRTHQTSPPRRARSVSMERQAPVPAVAVGLCRGSSHAGRVRADGCGPGAGRRVHAAACDHTWWGDWQRVP